MCDVHIYMIYNIGRIILYIVDVIHCGALLVISVKIVAIGR